MFLDFECPESLLRVPLAVGELVVVLAESLVGLGGLAVFGLDVLALAGERLHVLLQLLRLLRPHLRQLRLLLQLGLRALQLLPQRLHLLIALLEPPVQPLLLGGRRPHLVLHVAELSRLPL